MPWADVDFDPFAAPAPGARPKVSLTVGRNAPPPETIPDAPKEDTQPKLAPWAKEVDHIPDFPDTQEPEAPKERPGFLETAKRSGELLDADLHRQRSAASQGTTPNLEAHEKNLISDNVMEGDDGNLHYLDSEGRLQPTDTNKHVALKGNDGKIRVYARTPETDEGRMSAGGRLLQTGMATETPRFGTEGLAAGARVLGIGSRGSRVPAVHPAWLPPDAAPEAVQAAERLGVNLPKAIASDSGNTHFVGQFLKGQPGGAPLRTAIEQGQQGEQGLAGALRRTTADAGGVAAPRNAGGAVTTGLEDVFRPESQKLVKQLYDRVDGLVDPRRTAPLAEVQRAVSDILARRQARGNNDLGKAVETVSGALQRRGGLTYEAIKDLRTELREIKQKGDKGGLLPEGMSQRELGDIYTALTKDLGNAAEITGGPAARTAWERANQLSADRKEALEVLNKVIGGKARSDEGVYEAIQRMAGTGPGADLHTLSTARSALHGIPGIMPGAPGAWEHVASTVISRLGQDSHGNFSPNLFLRDYNDLSPEGKRVLFHGVGRGNVIGALDDIATVSDKYAKAGKLANTSGTSGHATLAGVATVAAERLMEGDWKTPITLLGVGIGANVTSRLLGAPATAASVARWTRAVDALAQAPGARAWAAYNIASRNLANTAAAAGGDPSIAPHLQQKLQGLVRRPNERDDQQSQ